MFENATLSSRFVPTAYEYSNGRLTSQDVPYGWYVENQGAEYGVNPVAGMEPVDGGGVQFDISTRQVHVALYQELTLEPGRYGFVAWTQTLIQPPNDGGLWFELGLIQDQDRTSVKLRALEPGVAARNLARIEVRERAQQVRLGFVLRTAAPRYDGYVLLKQLELIDASADTEWWPDVIMTPHLGQEPVLQARTAPVKTAAADWQPEGDGLEIINYAEYIKKKFPGDPDYAGEVFAAVVGYLFMPPGRP